MAQKLFLRFSEKEKKKTNTRFVAAAGGMRLSKCKQNENEQKLKHVSPCWCGATIQW